MCECLWCHVGVCASPVCCLLVFVWCPVCVSCALCFPLSVCVLPAECVCLCLCACFREKKDKKRKAVEEEEAAPAPVEEEEEEAPKPKKEKVRVVWCARWLCVPACV